MDNRRDFYRLQLWGLTQAEYQNKNVNGKGDIVNISAKGISLNIVQKVNIESMIDVQFELDGKQFVRTGIVVRCVPIDNNKYNIGVEFVQSNKNQVEIFRTLFSVAAKTNI